MRLYALAARRTVVASGGPVAGRTVSSLGCRFHARSDRRRLATVVSLRAIKLPSLEQLARAGDRVALDLLIAGKVVEVVPTVGDTARSTLELAAYDTVTGTLVLRRQFSATWEPSVLKKIQHGITAAPLWQRSLVWIGAILLLPWITPSLTHWAHGKKTNAASSALLAIYGGLAILLAGFLMGFQLTGATDWLILAGALILSTAWSYWSCERIAGAQ